MAHRNAGIELISTPTGARADAGSRIVVVYPGLAPAAAHEELIAAMPSTVSTYVVDLDAVEEYARPAFTGEPPKVGAADVAAHVATELRQRGLVGGDWLLVGWSLGGIIAYALTSELAGDELPAHLVVLDTPAPVGRNSWSDDGVPLDLELLWFVTYLAARHETTASTARETFTGLDADAGLKLVLDIETDRGPLLPGASLAGARKLFEGYLNVVRRNNRIVSAYQAAPPRVPFTLIRPEHSLFGAEPAMGWDEIDPAVEVRTCRGDHYSMLRDPFALAQVDAIARDCLRLTESEV
ncbi:thioesterase domain-containing protein [Saccharopolyspora sp. K220]|uniref:thioesterase domain-containing protein n=1 Tax=Saccharopolyspora soli TaxID=2926618 RepID=UPI001F598886|nr:thioesterase domain-containing protein [Saccharopolyspora soli]MCI2416125.1 thioesterase domain-containing protein [Saccharopolyspora soli]